MPRHKPIHVARIGAVSVPVTRNRLSRWGVIWREVRRGPRKRETFGVKARAIARADEIARALANGLANGLADVLTLTDAKHGTHCRATLAPSPNPSLAGKFRLGKV